MRRNAAGLVRHRREPHAQFVAGLAAKDSMRALFPCSAGKDRAGSVPLLCLGVARSRRAPALSYRVSRTASTLDQVETT